MNIQYQIFELDSNHLKERKRLQYEQKRVCFLEARLDDCGDQVYDTFEDCVEMLKKYGDDYKEYTIIPRIYLTR